MLEIRVGRMKKNMIKFQASLDRWKNEWMKREKNARWKMMQSINDIWILFILRNCCIRAPPSPPIIQKKIAIYLKIFRYRIRHGNQIQRVLIYGLH